MFLRNLILYVMAIGPAALFAESPKDNIVINTASETYDFVVGKGGPEVRHSLKTEYLATRHSQTVRPHMFYNNVIRLDKASGGKPQYRNVNSPTVFHDDSKVCYFDLPISAKGKKGKAEFRRTYSDPAHFTEVFVEEEFPIISKTITFNIPASMNGIRLVDHNFPVAGISREDKVSADGSRSIIYTIADIDGIPDDECSPAALVARPHISVAGYFPDMDSLYRYHRRMLDVDTVIGSLPRAVEDLLEECRDRDSLIDGLYGFVQRNIRYVAFEEGEAAFRPDRPSETLRKNYGDCKSMSLLLATLLNRGGIEAYVAAVGTESIPYKIKDNPSLSAADHMICIVPGIKDTLFLDPTHERISARHVPEWIRGKDAMMFTADGYVMVDIPRRSPICSVDSSAYRYVLSDDGLAGYVGRHCTEDMAEMFNSFIADIPGQHLNGVLAKTLVPNVRASIPADSVVLENPSPGTVFLKVPLRNDMAVTKTDGAVYIDLNMTAVPLASRVDADDRRSDYVIPASGRVVRKSEVELPSGCKAILPDNYESRCGQAVFTAAFSREGNRISLTKTIDVVSRLIPLSEIPEWNKLLSEWEEACNAQIEIIRGN